MKRNWSEQHVRRLFWRAGFGATPQQARRFAREGKAATLRWILDGDGGPQLAGRPGSVNGAPLDPLGARNHDFLWWLDRMVRSRRPLVEKMTLFWHDHFATTDQIVPLMLAQNRMMRRLCLGSFRTLLGEVTRDPAMQLFQSLIGSRQEAPNENYARELMELFTIGRGYGEQDVREVARALTGWRMRDVRDYLQGSYFDPARHDGGVKVIFGKSGAFGTDEVLDLVCDHPRHAPFLVEKLWRYFVTEPLDERTKRRLVTVYKSGGFAVKPVVARILAHPALYARLDRPDMVKSPTVFVAGLLRLAGTGVTRYEWQWMLAAMGQRLFQPPSVAGWDWGPAWLSTGSMLMRFEASSLLLEEGQPLAVKAGATPTGQAPRAAVAAARAATGNPWISADGLATLEDLAREVLEDPAHGDPQRRADVCARVLRHLLIAGPDAQLH
jgi:uncharacterized protein (DUF1800 family)